VTVRLSAHVMLLNARGVLPRALRSLSGVADEVCFVDTGSTDGTPDVVREVARGLGMDCVGVAFTPLSRPDLYFPDVPGSFRRELPLGHTGLPVLRDWAAARNLGLPLCRGKYVVKLDADDEVVTPDALLATLDYLDARPEVDHVCCPYEVMRQGVVLHTLQYLRVWRNKPGSVFREVCHENLDYLRKSDGSNWVLTNDAFLVRDHRDSTGAGVRIPHRNLKVLLREYESPIRERSAHLLMYLAEEAWQCFPDLALEVLDEALQAGCFLVHPDDRAWEILLRGRIHEDRRDWEGARHCYELSASLGWPRAAVLKILMLARIERAWSADDARETLRACSRTCYPRSADRDELDRLASLLEES
jgi:glycosyltransferase involved in cell wall biosynthesis